MNHQAKSMTSQTTSVPYEKAPEVIEALANLENTICLLEGRTGKLVEKLTPILGSDYPYGTENKNAEYSSSLAIGIRSLTERVNMLDTRIENLLNRAQI
jgi:hypothetical protein